MVDGLRSDLKKKIDLTTYRRIEVKLDLILQEKSVLEQTIHSLTAENELLKAARATTKNAAPRLTTLEDELWAVKRESSKRSELEAELELLAQENFESLEQKLS